MRRIGPANYSRCVGRRLLQIACWWSLLTEVDDCSPTRAVMAGDVGTAADSAKATPSSVAAHPATSR